MDNLSARHDVEYLRGPVASCCNVLSVLTEPHTAHYAVMREVVLEIDVKRSTHLRVPDGVPIWTFALQVRRMYCRVDVSKHVGDSHGHPLPRPLQLMLLLARRRWRGTWRLWEPGRLRLLWSGRTAWRASGRSRARFWSWGASWRSLRTIT